MKIANWILLFGFLVTGVSMYGFLTLSVENSGGITNAMLFMGLIGGYIVTVAALINTVFGVTFRISGRLNSFWKSLYPVNLGLAIMAIVFFSGGIGVGL